MTKKRGVWFILILIFSLFLVACGNGESESANSENDANDEQEVESDDTAQNEETSNESARKAISVHADTINSHLVEDAVCVVNSRFEQGWRMVFRATVIDVDSGDLIEDADVKVVLENGEVFDMEIGEHGEDGTLLYAIGWTIPEDFPTGTLDYQIVANVDGEEYYYEPFAVEPSKMTIIESTEES